MKAVPFYLFFLLIASCSNPNPYGCNIDPSVIALNDSIVKAQKDSYRDFLKRTGEPEIKNMSYKSYRLVVWYSFERDCWIYRLRQTSHGGILTLKKSYQKAYKEYCGVRDTIVTKNLSPKQWKKIEYAINSNCFWTMPLTDNRNGLDGVSFLLEAFDPEAENPLEINYAVVSRWSPEKGTEFKAICDAIRDLDTSK